MVSNFEKTLPLKALFKDYRLFEIFILGIVSGMPFSILFNSIIAWLKDSDVDLAIITTFVLARFPYSIKFLWSPIVDYFRVPFLAKIGHRKSWLILCTILISIVLIIMSQVSPSSGHLKPIYFLSIVLGILGATYDISYDAFRINKLNDEMQAMGSAITVFGYRIGMLITGAGALMFSHVLGWKATYIAMGIIFFIATMFILTVDEDQKDNVSDKKFSSIDFIKIIVDPFKEFLSREGAIAILLAMIFYKLADAMLGAVALPFYLELGFNKLQIGAISKLFGTIATICGSFAGGMLLYKIGSFKGLIVCGILQAIVNLSFIWLHAQGNDVFALTMVIGIENFCWGMGSAALVGYLSMICNKKYSATQYALFSSCTGVFNNTVAAYSGKLVQIMGWDQFFAFTVVLAVPGLLILVYLQKRFGDVK